MISAVLLLFGTMVYAQDSAQVHHEIDSIWSVKIKVKHHNYKSDHDNIEYKVSHDRKSNEIVYIREIQSNTSNGLTNRWIYSYHFRNGHIILISKWNGRGIKDPPRLMAYYYYKNDLLVYISEKGTKIPVIEAEVEKAKLLRVKFSKQ